MQYSIRLESVHVLLSVCSVYELYSSLLSAKKQYTYDLYTVFEDEDGGTAVAVGLAAVDSVGKAKGKRESTFPVELLDKGIAFKCEDGEASGEFFFLSLSCRSPTSMSLCTLCAQFLLTRRRSWPRSAVRANVSTAWCMAWWLPLHWSWC